MHKRILLTLLLFFVATGAASAATFRLSGIAAMDPGHYERRSGFADRGRVERYFLEVRPELLSTYLDLSAGMQWQGVQPWRTPEVAGHGLDYYRKWECWDVERWRPALDILMRVRPTGNPHWSLYNRWYQPFNASESKEGYYWRTGVSAHYDWEFSLGW